MGQSWDGVAVNNAVRQDALVDPVVVPGIMRSHLVSPGSESRIRVAGEQRGRPFVIPRPLRRIPRSRVSAAVINQVELGIVSVPAPGGASAELPLVAAPRLDTGI